MFFYSAQWHRQHCILLAFEQFGALYIQALDDKYPTRAAFEPSTFEFRATNGSNEITYPQTRDIEAILISCWPIVADGEPILNQHWPNAIEKW